MSKRPVSTAFLKFYRPCLLRYSTYRKITCRNLPPSTSNLLHRLPLTTPNPQPSPDPISNTLPARSPGPLRLVPHPFRPQMHVNARPDLLTFPGIYTRVRTPHEKGRVTLDFPQPVDGLDLVMCLKDWAGGDMVMWRSCVS